MNESTDAAQNLISENTYSHALADFQRFAGLNETGNIIPSDSEYLFSLIFP